MNDHFHAKMPSRLIPAASVIIVNNNSVKPSVLLIHRSPELRFHPDLWAFPGGHIDSADRLSDNDLETARRCAVRETHEETGLQLAIEDLIYVARWVTPPNMPRRFDSWFFLAVGSYKNVCVDGREIVDHVWRPASLALLEHQHYIRRLTPPVLSFYPSWQTRIIPKASILTLGLTPGKNQ